MRIIGAIIVALLSVVSIEAGQVLDPNPREAVSAKPAQKEIVKKDAPEAVLQEKGAETAAAEKVLEVTPKADIAMSEEQALKTLEEGAEAIAANTNEGSEGTESTASRKHRFGVFAAIGDGDGSVESVAFGLDYHPEVTWFDGGDWGLVSYIELLAGYWESADSGGHTGVTSLHEVGLTCYLRHIRSGNNSTTLRPYIDAGLGLHYTTEDEIEGKELGKQWLAGSNLGCGIVIGESERFDIGVRIRHLSNGGIEDINWGINHLMLRAAIRF